MNGPKYPPQLLHSEGAELNPLGLYRDSQGRIRTMGGLYVCAVSGRVHEKRLWRVPDYLPGEGWGALWVDDHEAQAAGLNVAAGLGGAVGIIGQLGKIFL